MNKNKIIYSLNEEDIQTVSNEELGRDLSSEEIEKIKDVIAEKINWYDAISETINERISSVIVSWTSLGFCLLLNSEQNPEECDATDANSSNTVGYIKI